MKKLTSLLLALAMTVGLMAGCTNPSESGSAAPSPSAGTSAGDAAA